MVLWVVGTSIQVEFSDASARTKLQPCVETSILKLSDGSPTSHGDRQGLMRGRGWLMSPLRNSILLWHSALVTRHRVREDDSVSPHSSPLQCYDTHTCLRRPTSDNSKLFL